MRSTTHVIFTELKAGQRQMVVVRGEGALWKVCVSFQTKESIFLITKQQRKELER